MADLMLMPFTFTNDADGLPDLTAGIDNAMTLKVTNRTGADITLASDTSKLVLHLPASFFNAKQMTDMVPTAPGWTGATAAADSTVTFTCSRDGTLWPQANTLTFAITGMRSDAAHDTALIHLAPEMSGNVPDDVPGTLKVKAATPAGGQTGPLPLAASLSGSGIVYLSSKSDPLVNSLELTVTNTSAEPLCTGSLPAGSPSPQIAVSFVYGTSAGALAPCTWPPNETPPPDSAWQIQADIVTASDEHQWVLENPVWSPKADPPSWILTPATGNSELLGPVTGDSANFSVEFSQIRCFGKVPGHTQMIVLCTGFMKDAQTHYDDLVLVLDLDKPKPPATRGLVAFGAHRTDPVITVTKPGIVLKLRFKWTMYGGVGRVHLVTSSPAVAPLKREYLEPALLETGKCTLEIPAPEHGGAIFTTLQAFDESGTFLNQLQFTIAVLALYVTDDDGTTYPVRRFGSTLWMTADYAYQDPKRRSSRYPGRVTGPVGRLYEWQAAYDNAPSGWRLPTSADWQALLTAKAWSAAPYGALIDGGFAGFDAVLGGRFVPSDTPQFEAQNTNGYYWTASEQGAMQFLSNNQQIQSLDGVSAATQMAVRYVRHL